MEYLDHCGKNITYNGRFFDNLAQARDIWEKKTTAEELPPLVESVACP